MTDVQPSGRNATRRGLPLLLEANAFELITAGHNELRNHKAEPNLARIAKAAGINKQRLSDFNNGTVAGIDTMGALVRCYARLHGVTDKEALAVLLYVPGADNTEAVAA